HRSDRFWTHRPSHFDCPLSEGVLVFGKAGVTWSHAYSPGACDSAEPPGRRNRAAQPATQLPGRFGDLVGDSAPMKEIFSLIRQVAPTTASALITGESGT